MDEIQTEVQTMVQTEIAIDDSRFLLAQSQDLDELRRRIEEAVGSSGQFVDFVVVGNRAVSALIGPRSRIVLAVESVQFDPRDTGIAGEMYGGLFDF